MEKRPFKIGQKVKILLRKTGQEYEFPLYTDDMLEYSETIDEIVGYSYGGFIQLRNNRFYWHPNWLAKVKKINVTRRRI